MPFHFIVWAPRFSTILRTSKNILDAPQQLSLHRQRKTTAANGRQVKYGYEKAMSKIRTFLEKLQGVKRTGNGKYVSKCPAHADRSPSLSIKETESGDVLFHCFAGCTFGDVLAALSLRASDCFADSGPVTRRYNAQHKAHRVQSETEMLRSRYGLTSTYAVRLVQRRLELERSA